MRSVVLAGVLAAAGCGDDEWVRVNFGGQNMRDVPPGSLAVERAGSWTAATLTPEHQDYFAQAPFSVLLYEGDRVEDGRTERDWMTRNVAVEGVTDLGAALALAPLVEQLRTDTSGAERIVPVSESVVDVRFEKQVEGGWALGRTARFARGAEGRWTEVR